jgi:3-oxoacyl-[acyl-carrier-protein] synthase-1
VVATERQDHFSDPGRDGSFKGQGGCEIMTMGALNVINTGLMTPVGLSAPRACAAIRAKLANPTETGFMGADGKFLRAHQVPLKAAWRGQRKLIMMAAGAALEALDPVAGLGSEPIPVLLCVAEKTRPGRLRDLDRTLFDGLEAQCGLRFHPTHSRIVPSGKVGPLIALAAAQKLLSEASAEHVLIVATDSLLAGPTLAAYGEQRRLLNTANSNGFMPGEGAGALLVARHGGPGLECLGLGFGVEPASFHSEEPLRADGMTQAIRDALAQAGLTLAQIGYRICTLNGEQYWFKEFDLACSRLLRGRHEFMDLWHPAESVGDSGAALAVVCLSLALTAAQKGYAAGDPVLVASSNEEGACAAAVFRSVGVQ